MGVLRGGPGEQAGGQADEFLAVQYEEAVRRARIAGKKQTLYYIVNSVKEKLRWQRFFPQARSLGLSHPSVQADLAEFNRYAYVTDEAEGLVKVESRGFLEEVIGGKRDILVTHVRNDARCSENVGTMTDMLRKGDIDPVIGIVEDAYASNHYDETLYYIDIVDDHFGRRSPDDPKPIGCVKLLSLVARLRGNPMLGVERRSVGLSKEEIRLVEAAVRPAREGTHLPAAKVEDAAWDMVDSMSDKGKLELIMRLRRIQESSLPPGVTRFNLEDVIGRAFWVENERRMLSWIDDGRLFTLADEVDAGDVAAGLRRLKLNPTGEVAVGHSESDPDAWTVTTSEPGQMWLIRHDIKAGEVRVYDHRESQDNLRGTLLVEREDDGVRVYLPDVPQTYLRNFRSVSGDLWRFLSISEGDHERVADTVRRLPKEHVISFLRAISRLRKGPRADYRMEYVNAFHELLTNPVADHADVEGIVSISNYSQNRICTVNAVTDELDCLPGDEKERIGQRTKEKLERITSISPKELMDLANLLGVCGRVDPTVRLPPVASLLAAKEVIETEGRAELGWYFLMGVATVSSNHHSLTLLTDLASTARQPDFFSEMEHVSSLGAVSLAALGQVRSNAEFTGYVERLRSGAVPGLSGRNLQEQRLLLDVFEALASDTEYMVGLSGAVLEMAKSPEAAYEFFRRYSIESASVRWDWRLFQCTDFIEQGERIFDLDFTGAFADRLADVRGIRGLEGLKLRDRGLSDLVSVAMGRGVEHLAVVAGPGVIDGVRRNFTQRRYLVEEFLGHLRGDRLDSARAYAVMLRCEDTPKGRRTVEEAGQLLRRGTLGEEYLALMDWSDVTPDNLLEGLGGLERFRVELGRSGLNEAGREDYLSACKKAPALSAPGEVRRLSALVEGMPPGVGEGLAGLLKDVADESGPETAVAVLDSSRLAQTLRSLEATPYSAGLYVGLLRDKAGAFTAGGADDIVEAAYRDDDLQVASAIECSIKWGDGFPLRDRGAVIGAIRDVGPECRAVLFSMGDSEQLRRLRDPEFMTQLAAFIGENQSVVELAKSPLYLEVEEGVVREIRGAEEKRG